MTHIHFQDLYTQTPLIRSSSLSQITGREIYLKLETDQPTGSFKNRGMGNFCLQKMREGATAFVSSSGGNAGLAASYSAKLLNKPITVVVPTTTTEYMVEKIKEQGASIIVHGKEWGEADQFARQLCKEKNACYVPPFDDPLLWEGYATLIQEVADQQFKPDAIVLSVGGGGLLCGVLKGMESLNWGDIPVFTAETTNSASLHAAIRAGRVVNIESLDTVATSLAARRVAEQAFAWTKKHSISSKVVTDRDAIAACRSFYHDHGYIIEPAAGAPLALCYNRDRDLLTYNKVLVIVCGGSGTSKEKLDDWCKEFGIS